MLLHMFIGSVVAVATGCGGSNAPATSSNAAPPASVVVPIVQPPPRAKDDESDAWGPGGQRGSAQAKPPVECPPGSHFTGAGCVYTEATCPAGSRRVHNACIGDVTCPGGGVWDGDTCRPSTSGPTTGAGTAPSSLAAPPPGGCFFNINSIPSSQVLLDGVAVGWTPRIRAPASVGSHTIVFVSERGKKVMTTSCTAGETKVVLTKFQQDDPGY